MTQITSIVILGERKFTVSAGVGAAVPKIAVTYQLPASPPKVIFVEDLERTDAELRKLILEREAQRGLTRPRNI